MTRLIAAVTTALVCLVTSPAYAKRHAPHDGNVTHFCGDYYGQCGVSSQLNNSRRYRNTRSLRHTRYSTRHRHYTKVVKASKYTRAKKKDTARYASRTKVDNIATRIVDNPKGCPSRLFCGCGVSVFLFGKSHRELWLAANWLKFPATKPAPGMVAARRGHVFAILKVLGEGVVLAYDPNSGGRKTRIHKRKLAGFKVVDPAHSKYAMLNPTD